MSTTKVYRVQLMSHTLHQMVYAQRFVYSCTHHMQQLDRFHEGSDLLYIGPDFQRLPCKPPSQSMVQIYL